MTSHNKLLAIPTNIVTGFLGVGKTTAITHLLEQKPAQERWAILVNEFGEVGIDQSLLEGKNGSEQGVFIREVPGGCMCCTAGLPMQMALNMLLKRAQPDRLIIEPTGLGHPKEVMETLSAPHYRDVLDIRSTITLVDARNITNKRYTENDTFTQQLDIADVVVANKSDLYADTDLPELTRYLNDRFEENPKPIFQVKHGALDISWLEGKAPPSTSTAQCHTAHSETPIVSGSLAQEELEFPESGYVSISNQGEGFYSRGWIFRPGLTFDRNQLNIILLGVNADRAKGVFITRQGIVGFNKVGDVLSEISLEESLDSRIEIIAQDPSTFADIEQQLLTCIQNG